MGKRHSAMVVARSPGDSGLGAAFTAFRDFLLHDMDAPRVHAAHRCSAVRADQQQRPFDLLDRF